MIRSPGQNPGFGRHEARRADRAGDPQRPGRSAAGPILGNMGTAPDNSAGPAEPQRPADGSVNKRMITRHTEYESKNEGALERLLADMASNNKQQLLATAAIIAMATTILGILITSA